MVGNSTKAQSLKKLHYHYSNLAILMHRITLIWYLDIHNLTNRFSQTILAYFFFNFCSKFRFLLLWNDLSITSWLYKDSLDCQSAFSAHSFLAGWKCLPFCCFCLLGLVLQSALFCFKWLENLKLANKKYICVQEILSFLYHFP